MSVLAMDTATDTLGVGLGTDAGRLISGVVQRVPRGHSTLLQPSIDFVLESAGQGVDGIERIGIGMGPGSYTGVRMAVATGKAMAHVLGVPLVPIPTVDAIAETTRLALGDEVSAGGADGSLRALRILVMLNARRHRAYGAWYRGVDGRLQRDGDMGVKAVDAWLQPIHARSSERHHFVVVHDFADAALPTEGWLFDPSPLEECHDAIRVMRWATLSGLFPQALVRLATSDEIAPLVGSAIHTLEPAYALPVEAEAKLQLNQGGRPT